MNRNRIIISVCDYSGAWSRPYADAGYTVLRVDPKHDERVNHDGRGLQRFAGCGLVVRMQDGGYGVGMTAGAFVAQLERFMRVNDCDATYALQVFLKAARIHDPSTTGAHVAGILLAPPCTDFAVSGARHFAAKDADGRTAESVAIVRDCLAITKLFPRAWWCLEQPIGRIQRLVPEVGPVVKRFQPHDYAGFADAPERERYTKRTCLFGSFNSSLPVSGLSPIKVCAQGSWVQKLGGKSERTKELRSMTPTGFARAFFMANN